MADDRRPRAVRLVIITDRTLVSPDEIAPRLAAAIAAVPPGSILVQVREKDLDGAPLLALVRSIHALGAPVWVNDRLDVALAAGVPGVHLPERGLGVADARRVASISGTGADLALGTSRHSIAATLSIDTTEHPDLIQLGPIWATPSKAGLIPPLGPEVLEVRRRLSDRTHLVAVGGISSPALAHAARAAGADAVAIIRAFWTSSDPAATAAAFVDPDS